MADYCTLNEVKNSLPESGLSDTRQYDVSLRLLITSCSRLIDKEVGQYNNYFYASTADETRYFDGLGGDTLRIDDAISVTSVYVAETGDIDDYTLWSSTDGDYEVQPYNYALIGQPIRSITTAMSDNKGGFPYAKKAVKIVGKFGYSAAVPADVKLACIIQSTRWFMRSKQAWQDTGGSEGVGATTLNKLDADVKQILMHYLTEGMA